MIKKSFFFLIMLCPCFLFAQQSVNIIPQPVSLQMKQGSFIIDNGTAIKFSAANKDLKSAATFFSAAIKDISGKTLLLNAAAKKNIEFKIVKTNDIGDEGYVLNVTPSAITIVANTKAGIIYGIQSLLQTLPAIRTNASLEIPCLSITDYPRFKYRGMHLDVSRHFFGPEVVKEYINLMASYKMNTFH